MRIGSRSRLSKLYVTWPHVVAIGKACTIEAGVSFKFDGPYPEGVHIRVGSRVFIGRDVEFNIMDEISVGDDSLIASGCRFIDHDHGIASDTPMRLQLGVCAAIQVGADCWIGANAIVLKGVSIGDGAIVGAGAVVTKCVPAREIWTGIPAQRVGARV